MKAPLALVEAIVEESSQESDEAQSLELMTASGMKLMVTSSAGIPLAVELLKALRDAEL